MENIFNPEFTQAVLYAAALVMFLTEKVKDALELKKVAIYIASFLISFLMAVIVRYVDPYIVWSILSIVWKDIPSQIPNVATGQIWAFYAFFSLAIFAAANGFYDTVNRFNPNNKKGK